MLTADGPYGDTHSHMRLDVRTYIVNATIEDILPIVGVMPVGRSPLALLTLDKTAKPDKIGQII